MGARKSDGHGPLGWLDDRRQSLARALRRLWALWPLVALLASVVLGFLVVWVQDLTPLEPTELSLIFGFGAGFAVYVQRSAVERRSHTIDLLRTLSDSQVLAPADTWMAERIASGEPVVTEQLDDEQRRCLVTLLDYYEFLCVLADDEVVDKKVLLGLRGPAMHGAVRLCRNYIDERRALTTNPRLYIHLEVMAGRAERRGLVAPAS